MKNFKKTLAILLVVISLFACEKEEESKTIYDNAKITIKNLSSGLSQVCGIYDTEERVVLKNLKKLVSIIDNKKYNLPISFIRNFEKYCIPKDFLNKEINLKTDNKPQDTKYGIYTYVHTPSPHWEYTEAKDKIIFKFPSNPDKMENTDATFTIYYYSRIDNEKELTIYSLKNQTKANLSVNNKSIIEFKQFIDISSLNTKLYINAIESFTKVSSYNILFNYDLTEDKTRTSILIKDNKKVLLRSVTEKTFAKQNSNYFIKKYKGNIELSNVKLDFEIDHEKIFNIIKESGLSNSAITPINKAILADIYVDNEKVGILKLVSLGSIPFNFIIEFNDKTTMSDNTYRDFIENVTDIIIKNQASKN